MRTVLTQEADLKINPAYFVYAGCNGSANEFLLRSVTQWINSGGKLGTLLWRTRALNLGPSTGVSEVASLVE